MAGPATTTTYVQEANGALFITPLHLGSAQ
jgi:hypothetical protein